MKHALKIIRYAVILFALWGIGLALYTGSIFLIKPQAPDKITDAIVVFTGHGDRIEHGLSMFAAGRSKHLFISGVFPDVTQQDILNKAEDKGATLPPCCMILGREAVDTIGNAAETRTFIANHNIKTLRLVTSNFHMNRAMIELRHTAPDIKVYAHPIVHKDMNHTRKYFWVLVLEEYHKSLYRWARLMLSPSHDIYDDNHARHAE